MDRNEIVETLFIYICRFIEYIDDELDKSALLKLISDIIRTIYSFLSDNSNSNNKNLCLFVAK